MGIEDSLSLPAGHILNGTDTNTIAKLLTGVGFNDGGLLNKRAFVKTAATTYAASSTTMQNDPDLVAAVQATATYGFEIIYYYVTTTAGAWKHGITIPSGASVTWQAVALPAGDFSSGITGFTVGGAGSIDRLGRAGSTPAVGTDGTVQGAVLIKGLVVTGASTGNLQFQGAQATSNATAPVVSARSYMTVERFS